VVTIQGVGWGVLCPTDKKNEIHLKIARAEIKWLALFYSTLIERQSSCHSFKKKEIKWLVDPEKH